MSSFPKGHHSQFFGSKIGGAAVVMLAEVPKDQSK